MELFVGIVLYCLLYTLISLLQEYNKTLIHEAWRQHRKYLCVCQEKFPSAISNRRLQGLFQFSLFIICCWHLEQLGSQCNLWAQGQINMMRMITADCVVTRSNLDIDINLAHNAKRSDLILKLQQSGNLWICLNKATRCKHKRLSHNNS